TSLATSLASCAGTHAADGAPNANPAQSQLAPELRGTTLAGDALDLASYRGRVVLVDFWASWCKPCRRELPELATLATRYADAGLVVVGINEDDNLADANSFLTHNPLDFQLIHDGDKQIAEAWSPEKMPTLFLIERDGTIGMVIAGETPTLIEDLEAALATRLENDQ
ncbi:MAG: TlpA family protein disulfide reductase, partial [Nannocystaceae bacterium]